MDGNISINSEELMDAVGIIDEGLNTLQSSMTTSISSNFQALIDTGLFSNGISKLNEQIKSLTTSSGNLITKFMAHTNEFMELENEIENLANSYGSSNSYTSGGGGGGSSYSVSSPEVGNVEQGTSVSSGNLATEISSLDDSSQLNLINFLSVNKDDDITLQSLLFNSSKAGILLTLLKKLYKDVDTSKLTMDDAYTLQKSLLKTISSNDTLMQQISENTILSAKKYLESVATDNNTTFEELILNDKYDDLLANSVRKLYDGEDVSKYNVDSNMVNSIRTIVDNVASSKGVSAEEVITNKEYLSILKG